MIESMEQVGPIDGVVTIFPNIYRTKDPHHVSIWKIFDRIRTGKVKEQVEKIRSCGSKEERHELKKQLPSVCFAGSFKHRDNHGIIEHAGFICLDFDHLVSEEKLLEFKEKLKKSRYVFAAFISPSGDGMKVIVRIPKDIENHSKYAEALGKWFRQDDQKVDELKDIARVCYESYDPDIYVNENALVFDVVSKPKPVVMEHTSEGDKIADPHMVFRNLKKWADDRDSYHDGNKHKFLVKLACACNRFGLEQEFVVSKLKEGYQGVASWVDSDDFHDIVRRVYITYEEQHGGSHWTVKGEMCDYDPDGKARDVIYVNDIRADMLSSFYKGDSRGETTYFKTLDRHWTWKRGEVTLMHGAPNQGKSILMLQLMLLKSINEKVKWGIFSPEQNPPIDFYKDLIHMYIGKSTEPWHKYRMSEKEFNQGMDFMQEHFYFVYPKDESPTPQYINDRFSELIIKHGIDGCLIDPFNQLDNDWASAGGRDDQYISAFGAKEKRYALTKQVYKIIIAHPKGGMSKLTEKDCDKDLQNAGNYRCADMYDIAGGAMWGNKMDNVLCAYQPYFQTRISNPTKLMSDAGKFLRMTQFKSQKIKKQKLIGIPGTANLIFNPKEFRYYEEVGYKEIDDGPDGSMLGMANKAAGVYSPFDKEYAEIAEKGRLQEEVKPTDWDKFITKAKVTVEVKQQQEQQDKDDATMLEVGIDPSLDEADAYDVDASSYEQEENYDEFFPEDQDV